MKYLFLIFLKFFVCIQVFAQVKDTNYKQLKEIEKKLLINKEVYLEILKVEKEVKKSVNKAKSNVEKYKQLIKKGYSERQFLEKYIQKNNESLFEILNLKESIKNNKSLLLKNALISRYDNS